MVSGSEAEQAARTAYGKALEVSLPVVEALAGSPERGGAEPKPPRSSGLGHWSLPEPPPPIAQAARDTALESGWLVAAAEPEPVDPQDARRLSGLDVAVKDLIDVAGLPVRNGTPGGSWRDPTMSAPSWAVLSRAGARCIGKAATHEMAWGVTTPAIGNPHDPGRYAGGSSGGSAASVAAGASHAALGTDTGGSVRIPAALCGVVGLRPTHGSIDMAGITPMAPSQDVVGPLAPDVATCAVLTEELLGRPLGSPDDALPRRVGVLTEPGALGPEVAAAYADTLAGLTERGIEVVEVPRIPLRESGALSVVTMLAESAALHGAAVRADPDGYGGELRGILSVGAGLGDVDDLLLAARAALRTRTDALFVEHRLDVFLTPTTPCAAPRRGEPTVRLGERDVPVVTALSHFTSWSSATGWPAISVPVPAGSLPVGIQVMARPGREDQCLRMGQEIAQEPEK